MFVEANPREVLQGDARINHQKSKALAEKILGVVTEETDRLPLDLAIWPGEEIACAASFPGLDVVCSRQLAQPQPSRLTETVSRLADGRDAYGVFMHSAEDWTAFAVWSDRQLVRALSVSPGAGIIEEVGERLPFETPFWSGERPLHHAKNYPLPFHPLELGNEALKTFFGFILEGHEDDSCFDPEDVDIPVFRAVRNV
ncbi:hypothetical protein AB0469_39900 [Streptomyces sp. NPDC093801]|uniref:DUF6928 family protein n=1 Tax=Streptomyces sp. NPDC093801 TaxID=3155203 RepID=UPI00344EBEE0